MGSQFWHADTFVVICKYDGLCRYKRNPRGVICLVLRNTIERSYWGNMSLTEAVNLWNRYPQNHDDKKQIKDAYRKLQEESRSKFDSILFASYQLILYLDSELLKDAYSSSS